VAKIELIPTRNSDGTVALRAAHVGLRERLRRLLRRLAPPGRPYSAPARP
jgi:hypothetical protein